MGCPTPLESPVAEDNILISGYLTLTCPANIHIFDNTFHSLPTHCQSGYISDQMVLCKFNQIQRVINTGLQFILNSVTASMPPLIYFVTVLVTVAIQTPLDLALYSWVKAFPCASSRSRMIWHLLRIVLKVFYYG